MARRIQADGPDSDRPSNRDPEVPAWRRGSPSAAPQNAAPPPPRPAASAPSIREEISAERFAGAEAELHAQLDAVAGRLARLTDGLHDVSARASATAQEARDAAVAGAARDRSRAAEQARESSVRRVMDARQAVESVVGESIGAPWSELGCDPGSKVPALLRYGTFNLADQAIPALVPLVNTSGWFLGGDRQTSELLVQSVILRLAARVPLRHLSVQVFDPRLRGLMGRFAALRNALGSNFPAAISEPQAFATRLDAVMESAGANVELAMAGESATLTDLWARSGAPEGQLNIVVVLDYPYAITERLQEQLCRAASIEGPSGTSLIVVHSGDDRPGSEVRPRDLSRLLLELNNSSGSWTAPGTPGPASADPPPPAETMNALLADAVASVQSMKGPTIPLAEVIAADLERPWTGSSQESLDISIGREKAGPLTLSLRTENPPHPNLLIGGAVGQGKSNLLLDIVYSLAARYSPDELELHLLDFKRGLEFKQFDADESGRNWLPHVRVLCLESNPGFGIAVLRHLESEMERRSELFKRAGASSINSYRATTGLVMPRIVLIIDEFHVLFDGQDAEVDAALELLTALAKQGRAYGIHLLLASQTTTGVQALALKGDAIFAQFPLRMSLKNTADESQAILSRGNKAAADLTYRGEVIVNRNYGHSPESSNVRAVTAFADPQQTRALQARLWELDHSHTPMVFLGSSYADYRHLELPGAHSSGLPVWVGRPIAVGSTARSLVLSDDVDQSVAVVGPNAELALAVLRSMLISARGALAARGGEVIILDGADLGPRLDGLLSALDQPHGSGPACRVVPRADITGFLTRDLAERLRTDGPPWLVVAAGLQRVRGMDEQAAGAEASIPTFSMAGGDETTPRGIWAKTAGEGGLADVQSVGWWPNLRALRADLPGGRGVGAYVTADLGREDMKELFGALAPRIDGSPRVGLYEVNADAGMEVLVPFDPDAEPEVP